MKILVCLKESSDTRLNLPFGEVADSLFRKSLPRGLNPAEAAALSTSIKIRNTPVDEISVLTIGAQNTEWLPRDALATGADRALRIEDDPFQAYSPYNKSRILARAASYLKADLILLGASGGENASRTVGPYVSSWLRWPFVYGAVEVAHDQAQNNLTVLRNAGRGLRETVSVDLPAVIAVEGEGRDLPYASLDAVIHSREAAISLLSLTEIGVSTEELRDEPLRVRKLSAPRPRPQPAPLDSSLPAFDRILALLAGGMRSRKVKMLQGDTSAIVGQLFDLLVEKQVIKLNPDRRIPEET